MQDTTLQNMMIAILIIFIIGFFMMSYFLGKEIAYTKSNDRKLSLYKVEIFLFSTCSAGFIISSVSLMNFFVG